MSIYKLLNQIIDEHVGFDIDEENNVCRCSDPVLHESITKECTRHIRQEVAYEKLSKDAQFCINEWENQLKYCNVDIPKDDGY